VFVLSWLALYPRYFLLFQALIFSVLPPHVIAPTHHHHCSFSLHPCVVTVVTVVTVLTVATVGSGDSGDP
jgi:hypothetical protein